MANISNISSADTFSNVSNESSVYVNLEPYYSIRNVINWSLICLILTSIIGNVLILIVMSLPHNRKSSTAVFFMALAVSDIILVLFLPFERWLHWTTKWSIYDLNIHSLTLAKKILDYTVFHSSSWILVCVTVERVIGVLIPHKVKTICSRKKALLMVICTCLFILIVNTLAFTVLVDITYSKETGPNWKDKVTNGRLIVQWWDICMAFLIPLSIISSGSIVIVIQLLRASVQKSSSSKTNPVTLKLLAVNGVFIVTMSPFCIFAYMLVAQVALDIDLQILPVISDALLFLSDLNAALNFFVYCLSGSRFRSDVIKCICCRK
jgi:hypothetical protein